MKLTKKATSIIEAMIVLLIVVVGVVGLYDIFITSQKFSASVKNRIEAIEIAKEGIEAMKNIRDTNWLLFGADTDNCRNVLNYDTNCVGGVGTKIVVGSYIIDKTIQNRWDLSISSNSSILKDSNGFYSHSTGNITMYTRKILISYSGETMNIKSLVEWRDNSSENLHKVDIDLELTNRKE